MSEIQIVHNSNWFNVIYSFLTFFFIFLTFSMYMFLEAMNRLFALLLPSSIVSEAKLPTTNFRLEKKGDRVEKNSPKVGGIS